jgi:hypothetical protein
MAGDIGCTGMIAFLNLLHQLCRALEEADFIQLIRQQASGNATVHFSFQLALAWALPEHVNGGAHGFMRPPSTGINLLAARLVKLA